jgi:hypothetical protein
MRWQRDPAEYYAIERLHDAHDELSEALWDRLNHITSSPERIAAARAHLERAERKWAAALAHYDELPTAKGGE